MRLLFIADERVPSGPSHPGGLGKSAYEICAGLSPHFDEVLWVACEGSDIPPGATHVPIGDFYSFPPVFDVAFDTSHHHRLSVHGTDRPVLNRVGDLELKTRVPNTVVNSPFMQQKYGGKVVNTGIKAREWDTIASHGQAVSPRPLLFSGDHFAHRGIREAIEVAARATHPIVFARNVLNHERLNDIFASAMVLLHPSGDNAAPRTPLECAACGTPTICLNQGGAPYHVKDGVTGFVCDDIDDMVIALARIGFLSRAACRAWVEEHHDYDTMIGDYLNLLLRVANGERW